MIDFKKAVTLLEDIDYSLSLTVNEMCKTQYANEASTCKNHLKMIRSYVNEKNITLIVRISISHDRRSIMHSCTVRNAKHSAISLFFVSCTISNDAYKLEDAINTASTKIADQFNSICKIA